MTQGDDEHRGVAGPVAPETPGADPVGGDAAVDGASDVPEPPHAPDAPPDAPATTALARLLAAGGHADRGRASWARLPSVSLPSVALPTVSLPSVSLPTVSLPTVSLPAVSWPTVSLPSFGRRGRPAPDVADGGVHDVAHDGAPFVGAPPFVDALPFVDAPSPLDAPSSVDVPPPPPPADGVGVEPTDLRTALGDALVEAVELDPALPAPADEPDGLDDRVAGWVARAIEAYPRPSYPMTREWDVSIQGLVRLVPFVPRFATAPLGLLDRFGAVTLSPDKVGLDGKDVPWDRVLEIRTEPAWTCLSAEVFEADLAQFVTVIPPVPGRGWVLRRISELLMSLYLSVLPPEDALGDALDEDATQGVLSHVVTTVVHQRRFGTGEATVSAPSALLQLALPGTVETILATARARGIAVTHVPAQDTSVGTVIQRAATWRRSAIGLREDLAARWGR